MENEAALPSDPIEEISTFLCRGCGEDKLVSEKHEHSDDCLYCDSCYEDTIPCSCCEDNFFDSEMTLVGRRGNRVHVCDSCLSDNYISCESCGDYTHNDYSRSNDNGDSYCENCYCATYTICNSCDEECSYDETDSNGNCPNCHELNDGIEGLKSYSYKPDPRFFKVIGEKTKAFCGIELEMEFSDSDNGTEAAELISKHREFYCKEDGSLDAGLEMVSHPMTFEYARRFNFESLLGKLTKLGGKSYNTSTCGMHVHISRDSFSALGVFKLQKLIYENPNFGFHMSRRANISTGMHYCSVTDYSSISREFAKKAMKKAHDYQRYVAVNLKNEKTVEIRLFKGTLNCDSFRMNLEFCEALLGFCNSIEVSKCNISEFQKYLKVKGLERAFKHSLEYKGENK